MRTNRQSAHTRGLLLSSRSENGARLAAQIKEMPKSRQRKGDFPRISGARRKDNITWIDDLDHRKEIGLSRILGIFDKSKQLSLFTGYKVSVVVQPPENELATLMFSTNDDLFSNMATLVRRFGPRGDAGGACIVPVLPQKNRLINYLNVAPQPGLIVPEGCIVMAPSKPALKKQQQQQQLQGSLSPQLSSGVVPPSDDQLASSPQFDSNGGLIFLDLFERSGWRAADVDYGFMPVPPSILRERAKQLEGISFG